MLCVTKISLTVDLMKEGPEETNVCINLVNLLKIKTRVV